MLPNVVAIFLGRLRIASPIIAAALLYLAITVPLARLVDYMGGGIGEVR